MGGVDIKQVCSWVGVGWWTHTGPLKYSCYFYTYLYGAFSKVIFSKNNRYLLYFTRLLCGLNEMIYGRHFAEGLVSNSCSINISCCYSCFPQADLLTTAYKLTPHTGCEPVVSFTQGCTLAGWLPAPEASRGPGWMAGPPALLALRISLSLA